MPDKSYQSHVTTHKTQVTRRFRTCSKQGLASRTDGRPLARIIAHKMSAWVPHRKHTRHRRAVHAPARAEARRRRDIERGRVAERLRPRTTTSRLTCAESSASEFLSRHPPRSNPPMGSVLLGSTHLPAVGRWAGTRHSGGASRAAAEERAAEVVPCVAGKGAGHHEPRAVVPRATRDCTASHAGLHRASCARRA